MPQCLPLQTVKLGYRHTLVPVPEVAGQAKHLLFPANEILNKTLPAQLDPTHTHPHTIAQGHIHKHRHTFQFSGTHIHTHIEPLQSQPGIIQ